MLEINCWFYYTVYIITSPVILTVLINNIINFILLSGDIQISGFVEVIIYAITISLSMLAFALPIIKLVFIIFDTFTDRYFYSDYKDIIEEMIEEIKNKAN